VLPVIDECNTILELTPAVRSKDTLRTKAVDVLLVMTAGAYQTSILTYLIQRDLFPSLIKVRISVCCFDIGGY